MSSIQKEFRCLKIGTRHHLEQGMCFHDFCTSLFARATKTHVNVYGWKNNCPLRVFAIGNGWHGDNKQDGGVRLLIKTLGEVAYRILVGSLQNDDCETIGKTAVCGRLIAACIICCAEANVLAAQIWCTQLS